MVTKRAGSAGGRRAKPVSPAAPRRRRDPETARREILDAAEGLFAERGPDAVGLKAVAAAAGVSHALVTHYFGTYGALVEEVMARKIAAMRDEAIRRFSEAGAALEPGALLRLLFDLVDDPVHVRLATWAWLSGRSSLPGFAPARQQGLRLLADAICAWRERSEGRAVTARERGDVEFVLLTALSATYGYALGREPFRASLGGSASPEADADFRVRLGELLRGYLARR